jgi:hypothetical protein
LGLDESVRVSPSSCAVQIDFCALAGLGARDFESEGGAAFGSLGARQQIQPPDLTEVALAESLC